MKKRLFQGLFAIALLLILSSGELLAGNFQREYEAVDSEIIASYYNSIDEKDWEGLLSVLGNEYAETMESYINSSYYQENKLGVYSIDTINCFENKGMIDSAAYLPIINECEGEDISIYLVQSDIETIVPNEFYYDGNNYNLVFVGTVDSERKIVAFRMPLAETVDATEGEEDAIEYAVTRFGTEAATCSTRSTCTYNLLPSSIKVLKWYFGDGSVETVPFQKYVKVVACGELGYVDRDADYHYAGILAIRNYGWYHIVTADSNAAYHVTDTCDTGNKTYPAYQQYDPSTFWNNSEWNIMYSRVESIWNKNFFATDYSRFLSWYISDSELGQPNSGRMNLDIAYEKAKEGKNYEEILNIFYGNSSASSGDLRFVTIGQHVFYSITNGASTINKLCRCGYTEVIDMAK